MREHLEKIREKDSLSPQVMDSTKVKNLLSRLKSLFLETDSCLIAHYYTEGTIQDLAEASGGFVGDSLEMA